MNYKIESLNDYIDSSKQEEFRKIAEGIYTRTRREYYFNGRLTK